MQSLAGVLFSLKGGFAKQEDPDDICRLVLDIHVSTLSSPRLELRTAHNKVLRLLMPMH